MKNFLKRDCAPGVVLLLAAALAMLAANSPLAPAYDAFRHASAFIVNDILMAVFFLVIGIEIRHELREGALSTRSRALLPCLAALGGVVVPAVIYAAFNRGSPLMRGVAVPTATDIAFSLGVLALFAGKVSPGLRIFLMALAVIDDLIAVLIIAFFYTDRLAWLPLFGALAIFAFLYLYARRGGMCLWVYLIYGFALWLFTLASGVHPTVAGVALGLLMAADAGERVMRALQPFVNFAVMPLFAFANAGIALAGLAFNQLANPVTLGVLLGLFFGKQAGIFGTVWVLSRLKLAVFPGRPLEFYAVCLLAGIGFTMSLFLGTLAFGNEALQLEVRLGVLLGSLASALAGATLLSIQRTPGNTSGGSV